MTLLCTDVETSISEVHKLFCTGRVPTSLTVLFWRSLTVSSICEGRSAWTCYSSLPPPQPTHTPHSTPNSKHWFTISFLQPLPYLVTPYGPENCQLTSSFFVGAQTVVRLLQTTQIMSDVCFITDHVAYAISNKTKIV